MNTPNPLIPQGSFQNQQGKGKSTVKLAVVSIIAVHVVFFGGLLLQGCKRDTKSPDTASLQSTNVPLTLPPETNQPQQYATPTNDPAPSAAATGLTPPTIVTPQSNVVGGIEVPPAAPIGSSEAREYTIAKGDLLGKIAKSNGVTLTALLKANPNIDARKLKVGQKIMIPAATSASNAGTGAGTANGLTGTTADGGTSVHVVKRGETLTRIASQHGVTVKAIRAANGMKTDRLSVDQKLKIPASAKGAEAAKSGAAGAGTTVQ